MILKAISNAMHLRNVSMSVALPIIFCLHFGQMQGLKIFLVIIRAFQFQPCKQTQIFIFKQSETSSIYSLASFTDEMPVSALEDSSWGSHLFQAHLYCGKKDIDFWLKFSAKSLLMFKFTPNSNRPTTKTIQTKLTTQLIRQPKSN